MNILEYLEDDKFYHCWTNRTVYRGVDIGFAWKDRLLNNEFYLEGTEVEFTLAVEPRRFDLNIYRFTL